MSIIDHYRLFKGIDQTFINVIICCIVVIHFNVTDMIVAIMTINLSMDCANWLVKRPADKLRHPLTIVTSMSFLPLHW